MARRHDFIGSVLTPSQRRFLRDGPDEELSDSGVRMTEARIRERLGAAIIDFSIILTSEEFDVADIEAAFTKEVDVEYHPAPTDVVQEALAVLYLGAMADQPPPDMGEEGAPYVPEKFIRQLREGIERAVTRTGRKVTDCRVQIQLEIEEEAVPEDSVEYYRLPADQLDRLRLANRISEAEYVEAMYRRYHAPPVGEDRIED